MTSIERILPGLDAENRRARRQGYPVATRSFDLVALALAAWVVLGAYVDGIAHVNGATDDTFFTPFHLLLYTGMLAKGLFLVGAQLRNINRGHGWLQALPRGYLISLGGVVVMGMGGFLDFLWHTAFGIEVNIEAALSPSHLVAAMGTMMFITGPLRALWGRAQAQRGWRQLFPAIASALLAVSLLSLFLQFAHAISWAEIFASGNAPGGLFVWDHALVAMVIVPALLMGAIVLLLLRRWTLPFGAVTFLLLGNNFLMFLVRAADYGGSNWLLLLAPLVAGLVADLLLLRLQKPRLGAAALRLVSFAVPGVYFFAFFVILQLSGGIWWSIHMWTGVTALAGILSLMMSYVVVPPPLPAEAPAAARSND